MNDSEKRKLRRQKIPILLAAFVFIFSGFSSLGGSDTALAIFSLVIGILNLILLRSFSQRKDLVDFCLHLLNFITAIVVMMDYIFKDAQYIHFLWAFTAFLYLMLSIWKGTVLLKTRASVH